MRARRFEKNSLTIFFGTVNRTRVDTEPRTSPSDASRRMGRCPRPALKCKTFVALLPSAYGLLAIETSFAHMKTEKNPMPYRPRGSCILPCNLGYSDLAKEDFQNDFPKSISGPVITRSDIPRPLSS